MSERTIVDWLTRQKWTAGIGDDCAVYRPKAGEDLVFTTDFTIEGRHFTLPDYTPAQVGYKALARGLSDIAAMGAEPRWALISLAMPDEAFARPFFRGVFTHKVPLIGGDLSRSEKVHVDVTVCGAVPRGKAVLRSGARPGHVLSVSGPLGVWKKRPRPRLDLAPVVLRHASAAMDITDGLAMDLDRLLRASGVTCELTAAPPVHRGATLEQAWHAGEDYELLVASPKPLGPPFHEIGMVVAGRPGSPVPPRGWDHFG